MKTDLFDKPYKEQIHPVGAGIQKLYKFPNGYGASVVRFRLPTSFAGLRDYGSYTRDETEWELAVIEWDKDDYHLTYDTPITDDVMGYLKRESVEMLLQQIAGLPKKGSQLPTETREEK